MPKWSPKDPVVFNSNVYTYIYINWYKGMFCFIFCQTLTPDYHDKLLLEKFDLWFVVHGNGYQENFVTKNQIFSVKTKCDLYITWQYWHPVRHNVHFRFRSGYGLDSGAWQPHWRPQEWRLPQIPRQDHWFEVLQPILKPKIISINHEMK